MSWTRQDTVTFLIGLAVAVAGAMLQILITLDPEEPIDLAALIVILLVGIGTAALRYFVTEMTQRAIVKKPQETPEPVVAQPDGYVDKWRVAMKREQPSLCWFRSNELVCILPAGHDEGQHG